MSSSAVSPPLSARQKRLDRFTRLLAGLSLAVAIAFGVLLGLRLFGLLRPFSVPTGAMTPAVSSGDHVMMEGLTFLSRRPRRGDVVCFKTDGIQGLPQAQVYVKRVAGEPGEHVRISGGKLYISDRYVVLSNASGAISHFPPPLPGPPPPQTDLVVPKDCYFLLGDNSTNSLDSRFYGSVPRGNILGRISFCYWPPDRVGKVK